VDVLAFSPSQVDGWDEILTEAKTAGIPVVVVDRAINVKDESLYVTHIGSDMIDEGKRAANWLLKYMAAKKRDKDKINIVVLEGVAGSTPAVHRDKGFREVLGKHSNFSIVASEPADFIFSKGEEVMSKLLKMHKGDIDVVFAHNDEMALGAVEAIKKYGKKPGVDVVIIGVDAIKKAVEAIVKGEMNATIECSPLLGPQLMEVVKEVVSGKKIERRIITIETDFDASNAVKELPARTY
jgi:simple sugar transport system substrate-binding protein